MSTADFSYLTLRNLKAYQANNTVVPTGYILTTSSNGAGSWLSADKVVFNTISTSAATGGPMISTIAAAVLNASTISTITSNIVADVNIYSIVSTIVSQSLENALANASQIVFR